MTTNSEKLTETEKFHNKSYQTQLDDSLLASIALSVFLFIATIHINSSTRLLQNMNKTIIMLGLITLSIGIAVTGLVKFTTEFFYNLNDDKHREKFNFGLAIIYTIFISFLIIIEIIFAKEFLYNL